MTSFWDWLPKAWGSARGQTKNSAVDSHDLFRQIYGGWGETWAAKNVSLKTALQVSTALACGRVIAEGMAMLPWKVYQAIGGRIEPAYAHWLYDKLATEPNPLQTAFEFQETMGMHLAFCSNAFVWMPTVGRRLDALWLIEPGWVTVKYRWPELPTYEVRTDDGRSFVLLASEVWHIRGPSWNSYVGMAFMVLARQALGLAMAIEEGQGKLQALGVSMPGYLAVEGNLTDEQHKKLTAWIEKNHTGSANAGRPMILDHAAKWVNQAMTNADGQVLEQRKFAVEEVCRFMRVLPIMVGHADKTASYASSEQMFLAHSMYTAGPWARRLEQSANKRLLTREERAQGFYTKLNEKAMLRMTAKDQAEYLGRLTGAGIMVRNEARAVLELNPLEGLDEPLTPLNVVAGDPPRVDDPENPPRPPADDELE